MAEDIASEATIGIGPGITYKVSMRIIKQSIVRIQKSKFCKNKKKKKKFAK